MLAKRIPTILPPMSLAEAIETTRIHSVAGVLEDSRGLVRHAAVPFPAPHHQRCARHCGAASGMNQLRDGLANVNIC